MNAPKLHSSTELTVVRAGGSAVDQTVARALCGQDAGAGVVQSSDGSRCVVSPTSTGTASATAAILRPAVQHRPEWSKDLISASPFLLPATFIQQQTLLDGTHQRDRVRYIADRYDALWLPSWAARHGADHLPTCARPTRPVQHARTPEWNCQQAHLDLLEVCFTTLEVSAHEQRNAPLESIALSLPPGTLTRDGFATALDDIRAYWISKRRAAGAARPLIPALHIPIVHEYNTVGPQTDLLGDCPLPFKQREWSAPVIRRKPHASADGGTSLTATGNRSRQTIAVSGDGEPSHSPELQEASRLVDRAVQLSRAMHTREVLRHRHTQLALYELALLRHGEKVEASSESSWQRLRLSLKRNHAADN